jgi:hypothetical protein
MSQDRDIGATGPRHPIPSVETMTKTRPLTVLLATAGIAVAALGLTGCAVTVHDPGAQATDAADVTSGTPRAGTPTATGSTATGGNPSTGVPAGGSCDGRSFTVTQDDVQLALDGPCGDVVVAAKRVVVNMDKARSVTVTGSASTVLVADVDHVDVAGDANTVNADDITSLRIDGTANTVLAAAIGSVTAGGSGNAVNWSSSGTAVTDTGAGNALIHP